MTNRTRSVLYTGVTNSLERRIWFHRNSENKSFTKTYKVDRLVYFEHFNEAPYAIAREKEIKGWRRAKKSQLIASVNPKWLDSALSGMRTGFFAEAQNDTCGMNGFLDFTVHCRL